VYVVAGVQKVVDVVAWAADEVASTATAAASLKAFFIRMSPPEGSGQW
jgi:hypothetical protein